ncbi:4'-phosphopantetheinyl transferase superfamily protein [Streptomyces sp. NPDC050147]|uniref:4'-phosphopantetheinyl transferase family protein n=1 Tax=Streptomyces sp. NPDC050147 TaxID=3155513 RepID=UPI00342DD7D9
MTYGKGVLKELLPPAVAAEEAFEDPPGPPSDHLLPPEADVISRAIPRRQREFATVRLCARRAMSTLGVGPVPLLPDRHRAPQWPHGLVGSMTHCDGYRAAAVAPSGQVAGIGIDAEPNLPLPAGVLNAIALGPERAQVEALLLRVPEVRWDRMLFSAKETVFKVWHPLTRRQLGFDQALIELEPETGTFTARLLIPVPDVEGARLHRLAGRWGCRKNLVVTAITLLRTPTERMSRPAAGKEATGI